MTFNKVTHMLYRAYNHHRSRKQDLIYIIWALFLSEIPYSSFEREISMFCITSSTKPVKP